MVSDAVGTLPKETDHVTMCSFAHEHSRETYPVTGAVLRISYVFVLFHSCNGPRR